MRRPRGKVGDEPTPLGASLERVARDLTGHRSAEVTDVVGGFTAAVGEGLAHGLEARSLVDGVLTVEVSDPRRMVELRYQEGAILRLMETTFGAGVVRRIRVVRAR